MHLRPNNSFRQKIETKPLNLSPIPMATPIKRPSKVSNNIRRAILGKKTPVLTRTFKRRRKPIKTDNPKPQVSAEPRIASILDQKISALKTYDAFGWKMTLTRDKVSKSVFDNLDEVPKLDKLIETLHSRPYLNIAICPGISSNWLVDVDVDNKEALELAPLMLPETGLISGRTSRPRSHYWYVSEGCRPIYCRDDENCWSEERKHGIVAEIRTGSGAGYSTQAPPSCNYIHGEEYYWDVWGDPAIVDRRTLSSAVRKLVVAACLRANGWEIKDSIEFVETCTRQQLREVEVQIDGPPLTRWYGY
jgi:hypothetical protein